MVCPSRKKFPGEKIPRKSNPLTDFSLKCRKQGEKLKNNISVACEGYIRLKKAMDGGCMRKKERMRNGPKGCCENWWDPGVKIDVASW